MTLRYGVILEGKSLFCRCNPFIFNELKSFPFIDTLGKGWYHTAFLDRP